MKERPILFSTLMVQAILEGRKTMTRRIIKPQPDDSGLWNDDKFPRALNSKLKNWNGDTEDGESREWTCPYGKPGDRLWVKETWALPIDHNGDDAGYQYKTDYSDGSEWWKWTPSIFMPRSASRITLEITDIRVERLQDISEDDARREGYSYADWHRMNEDAAGVTLSSLPQKPVFWFRELWESINGLGSWDANPWVWVIQFKRIKP